MMTKARVLHIKLREDISELQNEFDQHIAKLRADEFPIGTKVLVHHGANKFPGTVVKHYEYIWAMGRVIVKNDKTGTEWEKEIWELDLI
jgi:hypothetical protein